MGRMAAHTGREITLEEMMTHDHEFGPGIDKLVIGGESPLKLKDDGTYPIPMPGITTKREY